MFKFGKSESPDGQDEAQKRAEALALEKGAELESYRAIIAEREEELRGLKEKRDDLNARIASIISSVTTKLDSPSAYEDFSNDTELPTLKAELAHVTEEIARYDNLDDQRKGVAELERNLGELRGGNEEIAKIDAEIKRLSKDPNGERAASHRKVADDVDALVDIRMAQLKEKDKAESIIAILDSLDEEQKTLFLAKLKPEDKQLVLLAYHGQLDKNHEEDLSLAAEKQDRELRAHVLREKNNQAEMVKYQCVVDENLIRDGYATIDVNMEKNIRKYGDYKVGQQYENIVNPWGFIFTIIGFSEIIIDDFGDEERKILFDTHRSSNPDSRIYVTSSKNISQTWRLLDK